MEKDDRYTRKDWYTCEKCQHVNVVNILKVPKNKKKQHLLLCDDQTWNLFRSLAGKFGLDHGGMLSMMCGQLQHESGEYDTAI